MGGLGLNGRLRNSTESGTGWWARDVPFRDALVVGSSGGRGEFGRFVHGVGVWGGVLRVFHGVVHGCGEVTREVWLFWGWARGEDKETVVSDRRCLSERNVVEQHDDGMRVCVSDRKRLIPVRRSVGESKIFVGGREWIRRKIIMCLLWLRSHSNERPIWFSLSV